MAPVNRGQRGQATVELALCLPVAVFVLAALIEVALIASDQLRLWHAAREAVRVAVVEGGSDAPIRVARERGFPSVDVTVSPSRLERTQGEPVTVSVRYDRAGRLPLVGNLFDHVKLTAEATMRIEQP